MPVSEDSTEKSRTKQTSSLEMTGEFFSVGVALHAVRAGYVRRRADEQLFAALMAGRYAHVLAPERSGKSSLVAATAARLESNGCKVAILDLSQMGDKDGGTDSGRWYYSVAYRLLRQLRIRYDLLAWWQDKSILSNRQRLFEFYSEVILEFVEGPVVILVDEVQCVEALPFADQLLSSIRGAHNARATDPDFSRLSFALLGECDPITLMQEPEASPFNVTQQILLEDFSREDLELFSTELNLGNEEAECALDRIHYWTNGQPYLSQKLARAIARDAHNDDIEERIDRIARAQLGGRAAFHSEPHMSYIHRAIVNDEKRREPLLNLYGKIRKGIVVAADLGSSYQRRLMAVGLLTIGSDSNLRVRNRLYEFVFTARWANENLPIRLKVPAVVAASLLLFMMIPFWYTQWLPNPYVRTLASTDVELSVAATAYRNLGSFPGHTDTAETLFRSFLERRAAAANTVQQIDEITALMAPIKNIGRLGDELEGAFWDRKVRIATRAEDRDTALLASLESLVLATSQRRLRAASLVADDYPYLLQTLPTSTAARATFDPVGLVMTATSNSTISQYSYAAQGVQFRQPWSMTALEVNPLVRRVIIDRQGTVNRIGLTLNISHARLADLRIKIIAPSGRAVEIEPGIERATSNDDVRISAEQLAELLGESLSGTWSISVRDEALGIAGQLVGWNLKLNSQGAVEYFQRGVNIPDPVERETDDIWLDPSGRFAVARADQSDSARIWDLDFAEPIRAIALPESERLIGLDATARHLVTASQDTVSLWDTTSGDRVRRLRVGAASSTATLTPDRSRLMIERRGDNETRLELWSLDTGKLAAAIDVAGVPALVAIDASGVRVAIADFDRAVRVWDFEKSNMLGQFDLPAQPSEIRLSSDGLTLGAVYSDTGMSIWHVSDPSRPLLQEFAPGGWQLAFSPSGNLFAAGRSQSGFQIYASSDGKMIGPPLGLQHSDSGGKQMLAFSQDEQMLLTGSIDSTPRVWRVPVADISSASEATQNRHKVWRAPADRVIDIAQDGRFVVMGDSDGHVHFVNANATASELANLDSDLSFVGHSSEVQLLQIARSGELVASVAADNTLRLWRPDNAEPMPFIVTISGLPASHVEFSPSARYVAVLSGTQVTVIDTSSGRTSGQFSSTSLYTGLSFSADDRLYLSDNEGALQLISSDTDGAWSSQQVWLGSEGITLLRAAPKGDYLILVDETNVASKFFLDEGKIGERTVQLPSDLVEVVFAGNGTRAYFRTQRWVHRLSSSPFGLTWMDATLVPRGLNGAGIVSGNGRLSDTSQGKAYLPVAGDDFIKFVELDGSGSAEVGLFGSRQQLIQEWGKRISGDFHEAF